MVVLATDVESFLAVLRVVVPGALRVGVSARCLGLARSVNGGSLDADLAVLRRLLDAGFDPSARGALVGLWRGARGWRTVVVTARVVRTGSLGSRLARRSVVGQRR